METHIFVKEDSFISVLGEYPEGILNELGSSIQDYNEGKYILLNEAQVKFMNDNPGTSALEVLNMEIDPIAKDWEIQNLIDEINEYDKSDKVNVFYVNGNPFWLSKNERASLNNSIAIEEKAGRSSTVLWINNFNYSISIDKAKEILSQLELYAIDCYNNTKHNILEASKLVTKEDIKNFDLTKGYPNKLNFNL